MKKTLFGIITLLIFGINSVCAQVNPPNPPIKCGEGEVLVYSYDFNCLRLHRKSTGCSHRFSICADGHWSWKCELAKNVSIYKLSNFHEREQTVTLCIVIAEDQKTATIHIPIEIDRIEEYKNEDLTNFGFDEDYVLSNEHILSAGEYKTTSSNNEILVRVNLK